MRFALAVLLASSALAQTPRLNPDAPPTAYIGGQWWDGEHFEPRDTVWSEAGVFTDAPPRGRTARTVGLEGAFVVPPFGDAHLHAFYDPASLAAQDSLLVERGVFYALNPNVPLSERDRVRGRGTVVDVAYANGGVTAPGAHPVPAYERQALGLTIQEMWDRADELRASRLRDGDAYHLATTVADLEAVWPRVLEGRPDAVKVYLLHSEEWAEGTPDQPRGLSPAVAADVVRRAHAAGLPVVAHVETAADARAALEAGVDALAHAPGYGVNAQDPATADGGAYVMDDALLADLATAGVTVTPTLARGLASVRFIPEAYRPDSAAVEAVRRFHRDVYRRLAGAGVPIAIGADSGQLWAWDEVAYALEVGGLTPSQALRSWSTTTPRAVFPGRAIGALEDGFEASLLALACDPLRDWDCTGRIVRREKQGEPVGPPVPRLNPDAPSTAYVGGRWWDGERFAARDTTWATAGVFLGGRPRGRVARTVELEDRWVVPPFGDAHTHMLADAYSARVHTEMFEREGVFYALVLTDRHSWAAGVMDRYAGPGSVDVAYAHGGWTSPRTHPVHVYEGQALNYLGRPLTDAMRREIHEGRRGEDDAYFEAPTLADVEAKWDTFLSHDPDLVKVYLLDVAGESPAPGGMTGLASGRGLTPEVLREVARRADAAGLRVFAHVQTAADVRLALEAGVDGFAHLPGHREGERELETSMLDDATVRTAGERGVVFTPTTIYSDTYNVGRPARQAQARDVHRRTLRRLHAAGARVAIGADQWGRTSRWEADFFVRHRYFDPATVLDLWTRTTPRAVFPARAIGALEAGYEASLLALECDPTGDWACTGRIAHREKQGRALGADDLTVSRENGTGRADLEPVEFVLEDGTIVAAEQGEVRVPENRSDPESRTIPVRFVRLPSRSDAPGPPVVYLAGGPGGSGTEAGKGERWAMFDRLRDDADVILLDQRGTGLSQELPYCESSVVLPPDEALTRERVVALYRAGLGECLAFWDGAGVDVRGYTTWESAADVDAVRRAVGAERVSLLGISYGTHLALATLRRFPDRVDRLVLVSTEGPDDTAKLPSRTDAYLDRLQAAIDADPASRARYPDVRGLIEGVLARAEADPPAGHGPAPRRDVVRADAGPVRPPADDGLDGLRPRPRRVRPRGVPRRGRGRLHVLRLLPVPVRRLRRHADGDGPGLGRLARAAGPDRPRGRDGHLGRRAQLPDAPPRRRRRRAPAAGRVPRARRLRPGRPSCSPAPWTGGPTPRPPSRSRPVLGTRPS